MQNLNSIYTLFNDVLDHQDRAMNEVNMIAAQKISDIVLNRKNYHSDVTDTDMIRIENIYTNMIEAMTENEKCLYKDHCGITQMVLEALYFRGDFELLDTLRMSKPFCLLTESAKNEIKAILELIQIYGEAQSDFDGNKLFKYSEKYNLQQRESIYSLGRKYKGVKNEN